MVVHPAAQHRVVDGRRRPVGALRGRAVDVLLPLAAQDLPEGGAHLLVSVGVDDGVHGRVELGEKQEELLVSEDVAAGAEDIQEEDDETGRPADDERAWRHRTKDVTMDLFPHIPPTGDSSTSSQGNSDRISFKDLQIILQPLPGHLATAASQAPAGPHLCLSEAASKCVS